MLTLSHGLFPTGDVGKDQFSQPIYITKPPKEVFEQCSLASHGKAGIQSALVTGHTLLPIYIWSGFD